MLKNEAGPWKGSQGGIPVLKARRRAGLHIGGELLGKADMDSGPGAGDGVEECEL